MRQLALKPIIGCMLIIFCCILESSGQYYFYNNNLYDKDVLFEIGGSVGTMHGVTDVGRKKFTGFLPNNLDWKSTRLNVSFYGGIMYQNIIGARLEVTYGSVAGADSNGLYKGRNLSYRSPIYELALIGEFHPLMLKYYDELPRLSPYVLAGVGRFSFNPQTKYQGKWVDLRPLRTEGQGFAEYPDRKEYKLTQVCLPFGGGLKYEISSLFNVRLEGIFRYTFTDYIDDASNRFIDASLFSKYLNPTKAAMAEALANRYKEKMPNVDYTGNVQRGGIKTKDKYLTMNIKVGITLGRSRIN